MKLKSVGLILINDHDQLVNYFLNLAENINIKFWKVNNESWLGQGIQIVGGIVFFLVLQ